MEVKTTNTTISLGNTDETEKTKRYITREVKVNKYGWTKIEYKYECSNCQSVYWSGGYDYPPTCKCLLRTGVGRKFMLKIKSKPLVLKDGEL